MAEERVVCTLISDHARLARYTRSKDEQFRTGNTLIHPDSSTMPCTASASFDISASRHSSCSTGVPCQPRRGPRCLEQSTSALASSIEGRRGDCTADTQKVSSGTSRPRPCGREPRKEQRSEGLLYEMCRHHARDGVSAYQGNFSLLLMVQHTDLSAEAGWI